MSPSVGIFMSMKNATRTTAEVKLMTTGLAFLRKEVANFMRAFLSACWVYRLWTCIEGMLQNHAFLSTLV
ncbi:hypothetical protein BT93_E0927 [Corymbia citriodora subsp. variegata]|nr:hypothetical protein BT93_E0927 [Corymbia citriodora subsp. variegata]